MAKLIPKGQGGLTEPFEIRLGINRIGRGLHNDFILDHGTVSVVHCEVLLDGEGLTVRDLGSTNGTCVNGQWVQFTKLDSGQMIRLGSVELQVEISDAHVVIPEFRVPAVPPILKTPTGENVCLHHDSRLAVWKCARCGHHLCTPCIHRLRRRGGKTLYLCPDCSGPCELLPEYSKNREQSWLGRMRDKMKLTRLIPGRRRKKQPIG